MLSPFELPPPFELPLPPQPVSAAPPASAPIMPVYLRKFLLEKDLRAISAPFVTFLAAPLMEITV